MEKLNATLETLRKEYVLVQAFKKTVNFVRGHNWFADTLELDLACVDYPAFIDGCIKDLRKPESWTPQLLRLVPAPKSQPWWELTEDGDWLPEKDDELPKDVKLRPLAYVPLRDQVVTTALMMCLADRIETRQGDPTLDYADKENRKKTLSYGHRLFCDTRLIRREQRLIHRWGSSKLYRAYFTDYRNFISRPDIVSHEIGDRETTHAVVVQSDVSRFYDCVRPALLHKKLKPFFTPDEKPFFDFTKQVLDWRWHKSDRKSAIDVAGEEAIQKVALPQGLVSAGFFANIILLEFDDAMRDAFDTEIHDGIILRDACRYVDDVRLVVEANKSVSMVSVEEACHQWIENTLKSVSPDLHVNNGKTKAVAPHDPKRVMVQQSRRMRRIQQTASGGFDAYGGTQLLDAMEGLFNSIGQFNGKGALSAVPDVGDDTVARFVAGRFRKTFRSLRPLLEDDLLEGLELGDAESVDEQLPLSIALTKDELDSRAQVFGRKLVNEWFRNPGNVRLLRIGLDLFPEAHVLEAVLKPLIRGLTSEETSDHIRLVIEYSLSELFRAGATETGIVPDPELLPEGVDVARYHDELRTLAQRLMRKKLWQKLPWYLRQQVLLFLASNSPVGVDLERAGETSETQHYASLLGFLQGQPDRNAKRWVTNAVLAAHAYLSEEDVGRIVTPQLSEKTIPLLLSQCPDLMERLLAKHSRLRRIVKSRDLRTLSLPTKLSPPTDALEVQLITESRRWDCRLRNEVQLLEFCMLWLRKHSKREISPARIKVNFKPTGHEGARQEFTIAVATGAANPMFASPDWCPREEKWRIELGLLLRFILTGKSDPTRPVRNPSWRIAQPCYRPPTLHWTARRYGLFNGREEFGPEWLALSTWMETFLLALLRWPGSQDPPPPFDKLRRSSKAVDLCKVRLDELAALRGDATQQLMLPLYPKHARKKSSSGTSPLRVCIAQLATPEHVDGNPTPSFGLHDPTCDDAKTRRGYQTHLTSMLSGIDQMLRVRDSHMQRATLDLLILPELSVHPDDVRLRLLPFVRRHKCWVFTGLTFHRSHADGPLVNSGLWIVPEWTPSNGLQVRMYEQGKKHLAPDEAKVFGGVVKGHRPCQWLLNWQWSHRSSDRPLCLTGSICYDATDLGLASDLKHRSDIYIVSALNRDTSTFDKMTDALHYHMYQLVILANHGHFGGSNAYAPFKHQYHKQLFHVHGKDAATIAFLDIDNPGQLIARGQLTDLPDAPEWKQPPARWPRQSIDT